MSGVTEAGGVKASLFHQAFAAKQYWLKQNHVHHSMWDSLVFKKIGERVGLDRCRLMVSGSAPLAAHVMEFLRIVFCTKVVEGYGQTECGGASTVQDPNDQATIGHVGGPLACNEIKLVSVADLGYLVTDKFHGRETDKAGNVTKPGKSPLSVASFCFSDVITRTLQVWRWMDAGKSVTVDQMCSRATTKTKRKREKP
jgi:long-subunit acyl-CoA synthetase (AMP-forming)